jgi:hypothetical protein
MSVTTTGETRGEVVLRAGSQFDSREMIQEFIKHEHARMAVTEDPTRSAEYKREQAARLDDEIDQKLREIEENERQAEHRALDQEEGQFTAQVEGRTQTEVDPAKEMRALRRDVAIQSDMHVITQITNARTLVDMFEEGLLSKHEDRIRRVCPLAVEKLQALAKGSADETLRASARVVSAEYDAWTAQHPSGAERKRRFAKRRAEIDPRSRQRAERTRERLQFRR